MFECLCECMYLCVYACVDAYMHICVYVCTLVCVCVFISMQLFVHLLVHLHVYMCAAAFTPFALCRVQVGQLTPPPASRTSMYPSLVAALAPRAQVWS